MALESKRSETTFELHSLLGFFFFFFLIYLVLTFGSGDLVLPDPKISLVLRVKGRIVDWRDVSLKQ